MSALRYLEVSRLAKHITRKPRLRIKKERRAPVRLTKNPALVLIVTMRSKPSQGSGDCSGACPRPTLTTKAACSESIKPARQMAHVTAPARKASPNEINKDFQENVFKALG